MALFNKKLSDIMSKTVVISTPDASLQEIARLMVDGDCGEIPLVNDVEKRKVVGVVTDRDIVCRTLGVGKDPMKLTANDVMSSSPVTCKESSSLSECLDLMEENKIRRIPIVDDNGILCGIIAQADLVRAADEDDAMDMIKEVSRPSDSASQIQ